MAVVLPPKASQYTRARMLHWEIMGLRAAIGFLVLVAAGALAVVGHEVLTPADALEAGPLIVEIPAHEGVLAIAERLHRAGVIRSRVGFVGLAVVHGTARHLRAGEYELERGASTLGILTLLESGRVKQHVVLHPEGATVAELARTLEGERLPTSEAGPGPGTDPRLPPPPAVQGASPAGDLF